MTLYHATNGQFQPAIARPAMLASTCLARSWTALKARLAAYRTRKALECLAPALLEDLGVPHEGSSPRAGVLNRYPEVIRPSKLG